MTGTALPPGPPAGPPPAPTVRRSLSAKVIVAILLAGTLLLALISLLEMVQEQRLIVAEQRREGRAAIAADLDAVALALWNVDNHTLETVVRGLARAGSISQVQVLEGDEVRVQGQRPTVDGAAPAAVTGPPAWSLALNRPGTQERVGTLNVWESVTAFDGDFNRRVGLLMLMELMKIAVIALVLLVIVRNNITGPLSLLTRQLGAKTSRDGDDHRFRLPSRPLGGYDELDALVDTLNAYDLERQRMDEERRQHQLREANASKLEALGRLAAGVAHDFNNILGAIRGFAHFLSDDLAEGSDQRRYAERIVTATERGRSVVQQILTFFGRGATEFSRFSLSDILAELRDLLQAMLPATSKLTFENSLPDAAVLGDKGQLLLALINLCVNAHDSMGGNGGRILIRVDPWQGAAAADRTEASGAVAQWSMPPEGPAVSIRIVDSGSGIAPEALARIFDPFFTTKEVGRGTGLGLPVVCTIVEQHGGCLIVRSQPNVGTTMQIVLPLAAGGTQEVVSAPPAAPAGAPSPGSGAILVVDDDEDFCDMVATALERYGYDVVSTSDPLDALASVAEAPDSWDLMITDQTMPSMSGEELIGKVKAIRQGLPCVLCSGYGASETGVAEADGAIAKPVDPPTLITLIERLLGRGH